MSGGEQDCGASPGACRLVGADADHRAEAAGVPLAFDPNVPPLPTFFVYVTLDSTGTVSPDGVATLSGMIRCSRDAAGTVEANLLQRDTSGHRRVPVACLHEPAFATSAGYNAGDIANGELDLLAG